MSETFRRAVFIQAKVGNVFLPRHPKPMLDPEVNPKMFNGETDDLAAKPYIPQKKLLQ